MTTDWRAAVIRANTVVVHGRKYVVEPVAADTLREPRPHPRNVVPGTMAHAMRRRQDAVRGVAAELGISVSDIPDVVRQLRAQQR